MQNYATEYAAQDQAREQCILHARQLIKAAKQAIYALHRDDEEGYKARCDEATKAFEHVQEASDSPLEIGAVRAALEEFVEAKAYAFILATNQLPTKKDIAIPQLSTEIYLQGLSDCSGELVRRAVQAATNKDSEKVIALKNLVEEMQGAFLLFDFRGGELRKKSDMLRHNLSKIQTIVYEVSLRQ